MRTVQEIADRLKNISVEPTVAPVYRPNKRVEINEQGIECPKKVGLAVASMKEHSTDEGWQIFDGLQHCGWSLAGHGLLTESLAGSEWVMKRPNLTDVGTIVDFTKADVVLAQDEREWDVHGGDFRDPKARFTDPEYLGCHNEIFKLTIIKDAHQRQAYHKHSAEKMQVHAWVIYYHPTIVCALAPYVRPQHLIRTYHTIDPTIVPVFDSERRDRCMFSGAISAAYPMRQMIKDNLEKLPNVNWVKHPGYHRNGSGTPQYLKDLSRHKVAICTSSMYGYALRKIIEATACGCKVITDLPFDDKLPGIDGNLFRVKASTPPDELNHIVNALIAKYDPTVQKEYAEKACEIYDYKAMTNKLDEDIEHMRKTYHA